MATQARERLDPGTLLLLGISAGIGFVKVLSLFCDSQLFALRRNRLIFTSIVVGCAMILLYYVIAILAAIHNFDPVQYVNWLLPIWEFCLYMILAERTFVFLNFHRKLDTTAQIGLKIGASLLLNLPSIIMSFIISLQYGAFSPSTARTVKSLALTVPIINSLTSTLLNSLYLHTLLHSRESGTLTAIIKANKQQWIFLGIETFFVYFFVVFRIVVRLLSMTPGRVSLSVFAFSIYFYPIMTLIMYQNYVVVTKVIGRQILTTEVSTGGRGDMEKGKTGSVKPNSDQGYGSRTTDSPRPSRASTRSSKSRETRSHRKLEDYNSKNPQSIHRNYSSKPDRQNYSQHVTYQSGTALRVATSEPIFIVASSAPASSSAYMGGREMSHAKYGWL
ncbi:hypothetical protein BKA69DRAFT_1121236 [Paraphysoderma sedebokerense]|nr:hypothetical protein BKA69DRAFT_1121236 [Paraphysoderma sedebokerense]